MARVKTRYKSRKEQNAAMEQAFAQLSRAMGSLNEMETATASGRGGVSRRAVAALAKAGSNG